MTLITKNEFINPNTSFSGADMVATITITGSEYNNAVVYTIGDIQTLSYSLHMERGSVRSLGNINAKDHTNGPRTIAGSLVFAVFDRHFIYKIKEQLGVTRQMLPDEMPPFDITVSFANEYGSRSSLRIYGVRLINEGEVLSVSDVYTENTYQYVARNIEPLSPETSKPFLDETAEQKLEVKKNEPEKTVEEVVNPILELVSLDKDKVTFNVIAPQDSYVLKVISAMDVYEKRIEKDKWPYEMRLKPGSYIAHLVEIEGKSLEFEIPLDNQALLAPIVITKTDTTILGKSDDKRVEYIMCDGKEYRLDSSDRHFYMTNLKPETAYVLTAVSDTLAITSPAIEVKTFSNRSKVFDEAVMMIEQYQPEVFKGYADPLKWTQLKNEYLKGNLSLTQCFAKAEHTAQDALATKYANYMELTVLEKDSGLLINDRWLCDYTIDKESYLINANGISYKYDFEPGLSEVVTTMNNERIVVPLYMPHRTMQQQFFLQTQEAIKFQNKVFESYRARYQVNSTFGSFDYERQTKGAFLDFKDHVATIHCDLPCRLCLRETPISSYPYLAIKVDSTKPISLKNYVCYNPDKCYYLSLEDEAGNSLSRGYLTTEGYMETTFLSLAKDLKFDYIEAFTSPNLTLPLLDVIATGFSILVTNRYTNFYEKFFLVWQAYLYQYNSYKNLAYNTHERVVLLEAPVMTYFFDEEGYLLKREICDHFTITQEGYAVCMDATYSPILFEMKRMWFSAVPSMTIQNL